MSYLSENLATLRAHLEATYREMKERNGIERKERRIRLMIETKARSRAAQAVRRRTTAEHKAAERVPKPRPVPANLMPELPSPAVSLVPPARDLGPDRFVRVCARHGHAITFDYHQGQQDVANCPEGHGVWRWAVFDQARGEVIAAGSASRVVVAFDLEAVS